MSRVLADALVKLLQADDALVSSQFTRSQRESLDDFARRTQAIRLTTQGRGSLYRVVEREQVMAHLASLRPDWREELPVTLPQRVLNVGRYRDSKRRSAGHAMQYLLFKAIGEGVCWHNGQGLSLDLSVQTRLCGVAALAIQSGDGWRSEQPLWLVENQGLFDAPDWLPAGAVGTLCYYSGQLSGVMLDWLAERPRVPRVIHFPDYDGVGLQNFARLYERLAASCELWLIPGWRELLATYGNKQVWLDGFAYYQDAVRRLSVQSVPAEVGELLAAMQSEALALEQESVFLFGA